MTEIRVIDLSPISLTVPDPSLDQFQQVADKLAAAFHNIGFACLQNHGVKEETIRRAMEVSLEYFHLQDDVKELDSKGEERQGWVKQGREIFDQDEEGNIAEFEVRETFDLKDISTKARFPDTTCPQLRSGLSQLSRESHDLSLRLLTCLSLALDQGKDFLQEKHQKILDEGNATTLRSIHYPPIEGTLARRPGIVRCGEHSDYGTITLLYQDNIGGLEVKSADQKWVKAVPIPGTILVNVGDLLESMSGGYWPATRHRVVVPLEEITRKTKRQSIPFFVHPDDDVLCQPLTGPDSRYPPVTAIQHLENRFASTYADGKF